MISAQKSITSQMQNQLLLSQMPELFDEPIRGGDYDTSLNYWVEVNINLVNRQPPVWLEEPYWKPIPGQQYLRLPIVQKDLPPVESVDSPLNELLPKGA